MDSFEGLEWRMRRETEVEARNMGVEMGRGGWVEVEVEGGG